MRYWVYEPDGTLFAPEAGINHAFREQISKQFKGYTDTPPPTTPELVYRQVREYRDRYPNIALIRWKASLVSIPSSWAASHNPLDAAPAVPREGPSQDAIIDKFVRDNLSTDLIKMEPRDGISPTPHTTGHQPVTPPTPSSSTPSPDQPSPEPNPLPAPPIAPHGSIQTPAWQDPIELGPH